MRIFISRDSININYKSVLVGAKEYISFKQQKWRHIMNKSLISHKYFPPSPLSPELNNLSQSLHLSAPINILHSPSTSIHHNLTTLEPPLIVQAAMGDMDDNAPLNSERDLNAAEEPFEEQGNGGTHILSAQREGRDERDLLFEFLCTFHRCGMDTLTNRTIYIYIYIYSGCTGTR